MSKSHQFGFVFTTHESLICGTLNESSLNIYLNDGWSFYSGYDFYGFDGETIYFQNTHDLAGLKAYIEDNGYKGVSLLNGFAYPKQVSYTISEEDLAYDGAVDTWILNDGWTLYSGQDFYGNDAEAISNWENSHDLASLKAYVEDNGYQGIAFY